MSIKVRECRPWCDSQRQKINHQIQANDIMLIDVDGKNLGVVPLSQAIHRAHLQAMDLVQVSPFANPPVCRIMKQEDISVEFDRHAQRAADLQEARAAGQKAKELRFGHRIAEHDVQIKVRQLEKFLSKDKARVKARNTLRVSAAK
jgi:translation initiation factor IF-3